MDCTSVTFIIFLPFKIKILGKTLGNLEGKRSCEQKISSRSNVFHFNEIYCLQCGFFSSSYMLH